MSSSYKGHWLNGSKETGYRAEPHTGTEADWLRGADGRVLRLHMAGIKRLIDATIIAKKALTTAPDTAIINT